MNLPRQSQEPNLRLRETRLENAKRAKLIIVVEQSITTLFRQLGCVATNGGQTPYADLGGQTPYADLGSLPCISDQIEDEMTTADVIAHLVAKLK